MSEALKLGKSPRPLDLDVLENGVEVEPDMTPGVVFTVLPWSTDNRRFRRAMERRLVGKMAEKNGGEGLSREEVVEESTSFQDDGEFVVDAIIKDATGILNAKGNPVQYTRERGLQILCDDRWAHLRRVLVQEAIKLNRRLTQAEEDAQGN